MPKLIHKTDQAFSEIKKIFKSLEKDIKRIQRDIAEIKRGTKKQGKSKSGSRRGKKRLDLMGKVFGRLTVIEPGKDKLRSDGYARTTWVCKCECGNEKEIITSNLLDGNSTTCGCRSKRFGYAWRKDKNGNRPSNTNSPTYRIWHNIKKRCGYRKHCSYRYYGGKGIKVCERWKDYDNFLADMGERPDGYELHRIDHGGNYEPGNCKWKNIHEHRSEHRIEQLANLPFSIPVS